MTYEIKTLFKDFYNNPFIKSIENKPYWSISDDKKMPINMKALPLGKIYGASFKIPDHMTTIDKTLDIIPYPKNHAYFMDIKKDDFILLDIEPNCPEKIKNKFLKTPYIYGEYSLSGKGVHLVYKRPKNYKDFPVVLNKPNVKEKNKFYEIMFSHWVTFTRNTLPIIDNSKNNNNDYFIKAFEKLCEENKNFEIAQIDFKINENRLNTIPNYKNIIDYMINVCDEYSKEPSDFYDDDRGEDDLSKYEFGFTGFYYYKLLNVLKFYDRNNKNIYSNEDKAILLYEVVKRKIEFRPKHNEKRDNLPWLLYLSKRIIQYDKNNK